MITIFESRQVLVRQTKFDDDCALHMCYAMHLSRSSLPCTERSMRKGRVLLYHRDSSVCLSGWALPL